MTTFVALYRGQTIGKARIIAVSSDPQIVHHVAAELLREEQPLSPDSGDSDPIMSALDGGRRRALRIVTEDQSLREQEA